MLPFALTFSIQQISILKASRRKRVSLPPLGKVTREGVNPRLTPHGKVLTLIWTETLILAVNNLSYTKSLVIAIISADFALFSKIFVWLLSVFAALSQSTTVFFHRIHTFHSCTCFAFLMALCNKT